MRYCFQRSPLRPMTRMYSGQCFITRPSNYVFWPKGNIVVYDSKTRYIVNSHGDMCGCYLKVVGIYHKRKPVSVPIDDRKCIDCNKLEEEYHFVLECILYSDLRKQLITQYYYRRPNMYTFIELVNCENINVLKKFAMYLERAFKHRLMLIYNT